jgi:hypothetical protein
MLDNKSKYSMNIKQIVKENDSDDELFGVRGHRKDFDITALPQIEPAVQRRIYTAATKWLQQLTQSEEWEEFEDEAGEDAAAAVYQDFENFVNYVRDNNIVAALASLNQNALNYDWDEVFLTSIERQTGIDVGGIPDLEDPNNDAAYLHFSNRRRMYEADAELAEPPEPERKKTTRTKQKSKLDPNMFGPKIDQPVAKVDPLDDIKKNAGVGKDKPTVDIKKASQSDTLKATGKIAPTDDMRDMLSRMRDIDVDPDLAGYPDPEPPENLPSVDVNTRNLPAVAGQALQAAGVQNPDFHQVANLPGNMADQIRQLGKSLFGALTATPTKRIHVVANLGGQGPNTNQEVQAVAGFLKDHGDDLGPGNIDFDNVMPGYSAQTHMFNAAGIRWMLVKDFAGQYIYCWPEEDSVDASPKLSNDNDYKQLR